MTPQQMVDLFREISGDKATPPKCSDLLLLARLNEAQQEACRRARLIEDRDDATICRVSVTASTGVIDLDPRIIFIRRVKLAGQPDVLPKIDRRDLDRIFPDWENADRNVPRVWLPWGTNQIRLVELPDASDTLHVWVIREPLEDIALEIPEDLPDPAVPAVEAEIPARYHIKLVDWALYRHYETDDRDIKDEGKAQSYLASFEAEFGKRSSAIDETWTQRQYGYDEYEGLY